VEHTRVLPALGRAPRREIRESQKKLVGNSPQGTIARSSPNEAIRIKGLGTQEEKEQGWVWWIQDHTQPPLCRCRVHPGQGSERQTHVCGACSFRRMASSRFCLVDSSDPAGYRAVFGHSAGSRVESLRHSAAQPAGPAKDMLPLGGRMTRTRSADGAQIPKRFEREYLAYYSILPSLCRSQGRNRPQNTHKSMYFM